METKLKVGDTISGFEVMEVMNLPDSQSVGILARHKKTGLQVFHMLLDDIENLFAFSFKTLPDDSKGIPHILEHSVLAGSEKFPVKDPFLKLMKGSVHTFLNAMTYPDRTVYPAATVLEKDYFNLMSVYADAVFFPLLREETFLQEGLRFIVEADGKIVPGGIVYNEMQGAYTSAENLNFEYSFRPLFSDTEYFHESGGEPKEILRLTYKEFVDYHKKFYHPANCQVFLYGDIDTKTQLEYLENNYLNRFAEGDVANDFKLQPFWDKPQFIEETFPVSDSEESGGKSLVSINWLLPGLQEPLLMLKYELLSSVLLGTDGSPLYKALIDSGFGEDISSVSGVETGLYQPFFSCGLRGIDNKDAHKFKDMVFSSLKTIIDTGIDQEQIEGAIRTFEFRNREIRGGEPNGLRMMDRVLKGWNHGLHPASYLNFSIQMKLIRSEITQNARLFEDLIEALFMNNQHYTLVIMNPDEKYDDSYKKNLEEVVEEVVANVRLIDPEFIERTSKKFEVYEQSSDSEENLAKIPNIDKTDLPEDIEIIKIIEDHTPEASFYIHSIHTNGIGYVDLNFDVSDMPEEYLYFVPLFLRMTVSSSLPDMTYEDVAKKLSLLTGGFYHFSESDKNICTNEVISYLTFRVKFLAERSNEALDFVYKIITTACLDNKKRLKDILFEMRNDLKSSVIPEGSGFAALKVASLFSQTARIEEIWKGFAQIEFLDALCKNFAKSSESIGSVLEQIRKNFISRARLKVSFVAEENTITNVQNKIRELFASAPEGKILQLTGFMPIHDFSGFTGSADACNWFYPVPSGVAYNALAIPGSVFPDLVSGHERVLSDYLKTDYLWDIIRVKGGAYGASAGSNPMEGLFTFSSYRDPNIEVTFKVFKETLESLTRQGVASAELDKTIISIGGKELKPLKPLERGSIGFRRCLFGITDDFRRDLRKTILNTTPADIQKSAGRLLDGWESAKRVSIAPESLLKKQKKLDFNFDTKKKLPL